MPILSIAIIPVVAAQLCAVLWRVLSPSGGSEIRSSLAAIRGEGLSHGGVRERTRAAEEAAAKGTAFPDVSGVPNALYRRGLLDGREHRLSLVQALEMA